MAVHEVVAPMGNRIVRFLYLKIPEIMRMPQLFIGSYVAATEGEFKNEPGVVVKKTSDDSVKVRHIRHIGQRHLVANQRIHRRARPGDVSHTWAKKNVLFNTSRLRLLPTFNIDERVQLLDGGPWEKSESRGKVIDAKFISLPRLSGLTMTMQFKLYTIRSSDGNRYPNIDSAKLKRPSTFTKAFGRLRY